MRDSGAVYDKMENLCKEHTSHIFRDNDECLIMIEYLMKIWLKIGNLKES